MSDDFAKQNHPKPTAHFFEISLPYVFEYFAKFFARPPGRHYVGQPEWIVDRDQGRVVFKLFSQPDDAPAETPNGPEDATIQSKETTP